MSIPQDREDLQRLIDWINYLAAYTAFRGQGATVARTPQEGRPIRVARRSSAYLWRSEEMYRQRIISVVLPASEWNGPGSWRLTEWFGCMPSTGQPTLRVCIQDTHTDTVSIFEHRTWETGDREWCHKVPHVSFYKPFVIITDHKHVLMIHSKPLKSAPPRLQWLLVKIQGHGKQLILTDFLPRLPNPEKNAEIPLDVAMDDIMLDVDDDNACSIDMINFSINKRVQLREMSTADPTMRALLRVVYSGWPDTIKDLPKDIRPYWSYRDEIGISDGVIFKGKRVIIPDALRSDILHQLGIEKIRILMRESMYWPNIYKDRDDGEM